MLNCPVDAYKQLSTAIKNVALAVTTNLFNLNMTLLPDKSPSVASEYETLGTVSK